ncbi:MAG: hypothetical protein US51_C0025G0011 [Microgenomates group bacterium GW2011_GWA2_37_6]|nr:MAG: hypothetical protein US51_C0025G0011 [Microgenomates group bacterium GW2011_GWA2_37_6]
MKLIVKSSKLATIFTSCNVYSNVIAVNIKYDILSALRGKKLSLNLSNSYTHTANQFNFSFIASYLIVENF